MKASLNVHRDKIVYLSNLEKQFLRLFHQKIELNGIQIILTEIGNFNRREILQVYKNRYYVAKKCQVI